MNLEGITLSLVDNSASMIDPEDLVLTINAADLCSALGIAANQLDGMSDEEARDWGLDSAENAAAVWARVIDAEQRIGLLAL